jgi:hypothetical protein
MSPVSESQADTIEVGNDAGWVLEFHHADSDGTITDEPAASFRSTDYYATIDAHLQDGLQGGAFAFTIEGLVDSDYQAISQARPRRPVVVKLYLFWNDVPSGPLTYLSNLAGLSGGPSPAALSKALVAVLYVTDIKRKLGSMTYDTEIHAVEWAFRMMRQPLQSPLREDFYRSVCLDIYERTQIAVNTFPDSGRLTVDRAGTPGSEKVNYPTGKTYGAILAEIARAVEANLDQHGHQMLLIRDGQIYLGPRDFPLDGDMKPLTVATGLLEATADGSSDPDPSAPDIAGADQRPQFTLTLKGRPDIKPGDVVQFDPAPQDDSTTPSIGSALAGALSGPILPSAGTTLSANPVTLSVTSVKHRLGKAAGFVSEVKGVELKDPEHPWVTHADSGATPKRTTASPTADAAGSAASAIKEHLEDWTANLCYFDVGQVRSFNSGTGGALSPSQTETVWEGLREVDKNPNGTRRLPIDRNNAVRTEIPYASPFAWGKCGLVLPRYPGMRIALGHRRALDNDAVDMGAIWDSGTGPDSRPGDWWLSLPVGVPTSERAQAADSDTPLPWSGRVSQDLIDADGNRMIELGSLVVRVGRNELKSAGTRPGPPSDDDSITIEHTSGGSSIVMKQDGSIVIKGTSITIDAGSGDITMKANKVDVQVASSMDVR